MSKNKHAVALGRLGGKANKGIPKPKSAENGKLGGRPRSRPNSDPETNSAQSGTAPEVDQGLCVHKREAKFCIHCKIAARIAAERKR